MYDETFDVKEFTPEKIKSILKTYKQVSENGDTQDIIKMKNYIKSQMNNYKKEHGVEHPLLLESPEWINHPGSISTFISSISSTLSSIRN